MSVLAFDTCFGQVSVAVRQRGPDGAWATHTLAETRTTGHAERLLPMIEAAMQAAGVRFSELSRIAVSTGPGTFTGVRTGIAAARALSLASGKPVAGLTSLCLMMHGARDRLGGHAAILEARRPLTVAVDARRGEVYFQQFDGRGTQLCEPQILPLAAALDLIADDALIVGSGGPLLAEFAATRGRRVDAVLPTLEPDARYLAGLADTLPLLDPVTPLYLRAPDAKPQTDKSLPRA